MVRLAGEVIFEKSAMNLLFKRILLAIFCIALGLGGGYFMAIELFLPGQSERGIMLSLSIMTYFWAWIIGDQILCSKSKQK